MANVIIPRSEQELLKCFETQAGPPTKRLRGGWLSDLAALGKAIVLCPGCERKWNPTAYGYAHKILGADLDVVSGDCDACGVFYNRAKLFLPKSGVF